MTRIRASFLEEGGTFPLWSRYADQQIPIALIAETVCDSDQFGSTNLTLEKLHPLLAKTKEYYSFAPRTVANSRGRIVKGLMTGGRTFLISEESAQKLGLPYKIYFDLAGMGWGMHGEKQELRLEIKGGGTLLERAKINQEKLEEIISKNPKLQQNYLMALKKNPLLMISRGTMWTKPLGAQTVGQSEFSVEVAEYLMSEEAKEFGIKFCPTWMAVAQPKKTTQNIDLISKLALEEYDSEKIYPEAEFCNEFRFSPGNIRAVYFDKVSDPKDLCLKLSGDIEELRNIARAMIKDTKPYLEILSKGTFPDNEKWGAYQWVKFGDIHLEFYPPEDAEKYKHKDFAWYLSKDQVVTKNGFWFVDLESVAAGRVNDATSTYIPREFAKTIDLLRFQQELYIINVLRDFNRVITQFNVGVAEIESKKSLSYSDRKEIQKKTLQSMIDEVNSGGLVNINLDSQSLSVSVKYPKTNIGEINYKMPRSYIAERY